MRKRWQASRRRAGSLTLPIDGRRILHEAIGGYFELETQADKGLPHPGALWFQSGRAALLALLESCAPARVWAPHYVCSSVTDTIAQAGAQVRPYRIDESLHIAEDIALAETDLLIVVNYFGVRDAHVRSLCARFDPEKLIVDCTQSLFSAPFDCLATLYSPRKFVGVPDGGALATSMDLPEPETVDQASFDRLLPLIRRLAFSPEAGFEENRRAQQGLEGQRPMRMSMLTHRLLAGLDYPRIAEARKRNFALLHAQLAEDNALALDLDAIGAPMCYPFLVRASGFREFLIQRRIFVPRYWDGVGAHPDAGVEACLAEQLVPLPCDQRYGEAEMERLVQAWNEFKRNGG
jgi:hypothetical protein